MLCVRLLLAMWLKGQISPWWYKGFSSPPSLRDVGRAAEAGGTVCKGHRESGLETAYKQNSCNGELWCSCSPAPANACSAFAVKSVRLD